ncbi:hypothetical protein CC78DRAFT_537682 [Lojkania enalia]|uniref:AN1-type zinc finger protein n=1 Tax=Lojkania enalia TaxID=147567 RepID=A0A9P4K0N2_9PLEO|nr:hypothetical protein CC78DRAFT_537682 [Didymosphaeria enalia]
MYRTNSVSSLRSTSTEPDETMQIFIKDVSGHNSTYPPFRTSEPACTTSPSSVPKKLTKPAIPLTIPPNTTISTLRTLLSLRTSLPPSLRLVHAGKHLSSPSQTLQSYAIPPNSTLHMALPLRGGMPPRKIRCSFKACRDAAQRIVGDCGFCDGHFCGKHRLLEDHKCSGLEDCKKESHERNKERLESERTVAIRGI